jgi:hypothetical protein
MTAVGVATFFFDIELSTAFPANLTGQRTLHRDKSSAALLALSPYFNIKL